MASHSQALLGDALLPFAKIGKVLVSDSEGKTTLSCGEPTACEQRFFGGNSSSSFSVRLLSAAFITLAVVYFVLRCFGVTREASRVAPLSRSLASGGGRPCYRDGEDGEDEEEEFWTGELKESAMGNPGRERGLGSSAWHTGTGLRWPSTLTDTSREGFGNVRGFFSDSDHTTAAMQAAQYAGNLGQTIYMDRGISPLEYLRSRQPAQPRPEGLDGGADGRKQINVEARLLKGETLEMWEGRRLPPYAEMRFVSVFKRMMEATSACRSLLPQLTQIQQLRLSCEVMRLLVLELGAFSLVREHLEPLRSTLGDAVVQLGFDALQRSDTLPQIEIYRQLARELITMALELKQPRLNTEDNVALRYRKKMVSMLQTATAVVGYCLGVVEGLLKFKEGDSLPLPSSVFEQQMNVLKALYDVHSAQVAMDASLRYFIVNCQKRTKIYPILGLHHFQMYSNQLPPLREIIEKIHAVVASAGGLLSSAGALSTRRDTPVAMETQTSQRVHKPNEPPCETPACTQQREVFSSGSQQHPTTAHMTGLRSLRPAVPSSPPSRPIFRPSGVGQHAPQHFLAKPSTSPFSPREFGFLVSPTHPQGHGMYGTPSQQTTRDTGIETSMLPAPTLASERGTTNTTPLPLEAIWQEPTPHHWPYHQLSMTGAFGASEHVGTSVYRNQGGRSISDQLAQPPLLQDASRPTEQVSHAYSGWGDGVTHESVSQLQEAGEVEEVGGLLGELLKGGLKLEDVFPGREPPNP